MFAKTFRVKSNTAIKGSDRRKLRADMTAAFPTLGTDQVSALVPGKEELNVVKVYAHRGDAVTVYVCGGNPILFELEKNLYPTELPTPTLSRGAVLPQIGCSRAMRLLRLPVPPLHFAAVHTEAPFDLRFYCQSL